jgi:hypothetical protein
MGKVISEVAPSSPILITLMMEAMFLRNVGSIRATRRSIPEDGILHSHNCENFKSYTALTGLGSVAET